MAVDLNKLAQKLKEQRKIGVTKDGKLTTKDPRNDGNHPPTANGTTLTPKRFFS